MAMLDTCIPVSVVVVLEVEATPVDDAGSEVEASVVEDTSAVTFAVEATPVDDTGFEVEDDSVEAA